MRLDPLDLIIRLDGDASALDELCYPHSQLASRRELVSRPAAERLGLARAAIELGNSGIGCAVLEFGECDQRTDRRVAAADDRYAASGVSAAHTT